MSRENKILLIIFVNIIIVVAEISFGFIANSYALIADALHNAGDALAVGITYLAIRLSTKSATFKQTFGFMRAEMMAAFVNSSFLVVAMIFVLYEAFYKLFFPEIVAPLYMITIGLIALFANGISAYMLNHLDFSHEHEHHHEHHHHHHEDANIKSAYLHMLGDALISLGVVVAGIFIYFFKIYSIDAILTIVFSLYILKETYPLLKKSFLSLMDVNIVEIDKKTLENIVLKDENVESFHDLHIYKPNSKQNFISLHVVYEDENLALQKIQDINDKIYTDLKVLGFSHILIQTDLKSAIKNHHNCEMEGEKCTNVA